jgi:peptidoglycan hydrolase-like protein with peptidoglycan-binding domain
MDEIEDSVGAGGVNRSSDVRIVQQLLNQHMPALGLQLLVVDNHAGDNTITGIREYQRRVVGLARPDGRIDPGGRTWRSLDAGAGVPQ